MILPKMSFPLYTTIDDICRILETTVPSDFMNIYGCMHVAKGLAIFSANCHPSMVKQLFDPDQVTAVDLSLHPEHWRRNWQWIFTHSDQCFQSPGESVHNPFTPSALNHRKEVAIKTGTALNTSIYPFLNLVVGYWITKLYLARGFTFRDLPNFLLRLHHNFLRWKGVEWEILTLALPFSDVTLHRFGITQEKFPGAIPLQPYHLIRAASYFMEGDDDMNSQQNDIRRTLEAAELEVRALVDRKNRGSLSSNDVNYLKCLQVAGMIADNVRLAYDSSSFSGTLEEFHTFCFITGKMLTEMLSQQNAVYENTTEVHKPFGQVNAVKFEIVDPAVLTNDNSDQVGITIKPEVGMEAGLVDIKNEPIYPDHFFTHGDDGNQRE